MFSNQTLLSLTLSPRLELDWVSVQAPGLVLLASYGVHRGRCFRRMSNSVGMDIPVLIPRGRGVVPHVLDIERPLLGLVVEFKQLYEKAGSSTRTSLLRLVATDLGCCYSYLFPQATSIKSTSIRRLLAIPPLIVITTRS